MKLWEMDSTKGVSLLWILRYKDQSWLHSQRMIVRLGFGTLQLVNVFYLDVTILQLPQLRQWSLHR